jgi:hypothetical protein
MDEYDQPLDDERPSRWAFLFSWPSFLLAGWLLFELTSDAFLGVTVFCLKFGWEYFRTAFWLRRRDPDRARGKMCFWAFLGCGLYRTACTGTILLFTVPWIVMALQGPGVAVRAEAIEAGLVALFGFLACGLVTLRAFGMALWHRKRIFLNWEINRARANDTWPPTATGPNRADVLITTFMIVFLLPVLLCAAIALVSVAVLIPQLQAVPQMMLVMMTIAFFLVASAILWARDILQRKVLARLPEECWDRNLFEDELEDQLTS